MMSKINFEKEKKSLEEWKITQQKQLKESALEEMEMKVAIYESQITTKEQEIKTLQEKISVLKTEICKSKYQ